jgi:hypothetical protein
MDRFGCSKVLAKRLKGSPVEEACVKRHLMQPRELSLCVLNRAATCLVERSGHLNSGKRTRHRRVIRMLTKDSKKGFGPRADLDQVDDG